MLFSERANQFFKVRKVKFFKVKTNFFLQSPAVNSIRPFVNITICVRPGRPFRLEVGGTD